MPAAGALLLLLAAAAGPPSRSFSDLCREVQSDDLAGRLVVLSRAAQGWRVTYSATDGVLDEPKRATAVRYDPASGRLAFQVKTWERLAFRGRIAGRRLSGAMSHGGGRATRVSLAEVAGPNGPYPPCR